MRYLCFAILLSALLGDASPAFSAETPAKPNVLFIAIDDLNHWVGHLGRNSQARTPNIDRLAARGVRFTHAYCAAPVCNPSRAALMSGIRPGTSGVYDNNNDWRPVIAPEKCLPAQFKAGGYVTLGCGKIYHGGYDRKSEFEQYMANEGGDPKPKGDNDGVGGIKFAPLDCKDEDLADYRIASWGIEQLGKKHDKPFFLAVGLHKPHMPWNVPQKWYDQFPLDQIQLPPTQADDLADVPPGGIKFAKPKGDHAAMVASGRWKEAVRAYLAAGAYTDMNIGRLIDALDKSAYRDNTIIVLWGDHGWHLGEKEHWRKFALWEESTRAPLIFVAPGVTKANGVCDRTVDFMSIYPTLTDLCGLPTPGHVEGVSIRSLLADPKAEWNRPAITTYQRGSHAIRTEAWRYIRYSGGEGGEELYDEKADPYEWTNLAAKPEQAATKAELAKHLPAANNPDAPDSPEPKGAKRKAKKADE